MTITSPEGRGAGSHVGSSETIHYPDSQNTDPWGCCSTTSPSFQPTRLLCLGRGGETVGVLVKLIKSLISSAMAAIKYYQEDKLFAGEMIELRPVSLTHI